MDKEQNQVIHPTIKEQHENIIFNIQCSPFIILCLGPTGMDSAYVNHGVKGQFYVIMVIFL